MRSNLLLERLIAAKPALRNSARPVSYIHGDLLGEFGRQIQNVVFPCSGMISMVVALPDGDRIESAMVGHHGAVGIEAFFGLPYHINTGLAQIPGDGWSLRVADVAQVVENDVDLRRILFRCQEFQLAQAQQTAACNAKHHIARRLASWLLRAQHASGDEELRLTQEFLAQMLGVQRASISMMAGTLQEDGLIVYRRGKIRIRDRDGLERQSCGCHRSLHEQQALLLDEEIQDGARERAMA